MLIAIFSILAMVIGGLTRIKYVWQGNKIRRRESSADVSRKFLIITMFASLFMVSYNLMIRDLANSIFWIIEIFVVAYAFACCYAYYPDKKANLREFIWDSFKTGWRDTLFSAKKGTIVYTYVCGDLKHVGHQRALQQAKALGDYLIVGVISDGGVDAYKRRPVIPFEERMELIAELKCVDRVVRQASVDPTENLKILKPDILTHGDDWGEDFPGAEYMRSIGEKAVRTRYYPFQSTSKIINKIRGENVH